MAIKRPIRTVIVLSIFLLSNTLVKGQIKTNLHWESMLRDHDMIWTKMPMNYYEGPFVGNGLMGTVLFKDTVLANSLVFEIGRVDVYDHRTAEQIKDKYPWPKVRLPIGKLVLTTMGKIQSVNFRTNLYDAEITGNIVTDKGTVQLSCLAPTDQKIIIVKYKSFGEEGQNLISFRPEQGNSARPALRPMAGKIYEPNPGFVVEKRGDIELVTQPLLNTDNYATAWNQIKDKNGYQSVYLTVANNWAENKQPFSQSHQTALLQLKQARAMAETDMIDKHQKWWHHYYQSSFISIPDAKLESFYWLQQYRMASAGRPDLPPIDLLGPWYKPTGWLAIWANLNIQLTYYATGINNHLDMEEPYFKMIEKYQQQLIENVPPEFQNDCAALQTVVMFNDLSGKVGLWADTASKQRMSLIALPWIMQQFYLHYRFTMDEQRFRNSIYPLMKRAFNVYLRVMYKGDDGKYHLPLSFSDEYGEDQDVSMNLSLARWGFQTLLNAAERLKIKDSLIPKWKDALQNMVAIPTDERGIKIGRKLSFDRPHRHYSHLFSIFPLYEMNIENPQSSQSLMEKSIKNYTSLNGDNCMYKFTGAASLWAAMGNGNMSLQWLERSLQVLPYSVPTVTVNGFYSENGWPTFESPISATRSMLDMLIQSWGNAIRIFPAIPDSWKEASFHQLRAEGGFEISAKRDHGITSWVSIKSLAGEPCIVQIKDWKNLPKKSNPAIGIKALGNGRFELQLKKGASVVLFQDSPQQNFQIEPIKKINPVFHWGLN